MLVLSDSSSRDGVEVTAHTCSLVRYRNSALVLCVSCPYVWPIFQKVSFDSEYHTLHFADVNDKITHVTSFIVFHTKYHLLHLNFRDSVATIIILSHFLDF